MSALNLSKSGLWPRQAPRHTWSEAERRVYDALRAGLPDRWSAWHSLRVRTRGGGDFGEADFVIADQDRPGLLILEVKGGIIEQRDGRWFQNGRPMSRDPLDQAHGFRRKLIDRFRELGLPYPTIGAALCFPDAEFERQPSQDDLDGLIIGRQDLPYLDQVLPSVMEKAVPDPWPAEGRWPAVLHELWGEDWVPEVRLGSKIAWDEESRIRLDHDQAAVLESLEDNPRLLVQGSAGSGKTILARETALRRAQQGDRVLFLCFTEALGRCLKSSMDHPNLQVMAVKRFALQLLGRENPSEESFIRSDFWSGLSLKAAAEGLPPLEDRWDMVIVDEGQDLDEEDWLLVQECAAKTGRLWVFADEAQAFWGNPGPLEELRTRSAFYKLTRPYRSHPAIQNLADCYVGRAEPDRDLIREAVEDKVIRILTVSENLLPRQVGKEVNRLIGEGLKPEWIAVLSVCGRKHENSIVHCRELGGRKVCSSTSFDSDAEIVNDTCFRYKGLERPAVVVTDLRLASDQYERRMHLAVSRALSVLRVVGVEDEIRKDPVLSGLV